MLDGSDSAAALESLSRSNQFLVPLDVQRRWFRFHHFFAQILRLELDQREPGAAVELHRRAAAWHREAGTTDEAMHHAMSAGAFADAGALISEVWVHYANAGRATSVLDWLSRFPPEVLEGDARLLVVQAWVLALLGREADGPCGGARVRSAGWTTAPCQTAWHRWSPACQSCGPRSPGATSARSSSTAVDDVHPAAATTRTASVMMARIRMVDLRPVMSGRSSPSRRHPNDSLQPAGPRR